MTEFDLAFTSTDGDSLTTQFLFLIKVSEYFTRIRCFIRGFQAIALFNANNHEEAMRFVQELAAWPNADPLASRVVEVSNIRLSKPRFVCSLILLCFAHQAYLRVQLGNIAMDNALYKEAVDHFTAAVNAGAFFSKSDIHSMYEGFVVVR